MKIFISSTSTDLKDERQKLLEVIEGLRASGHDVWSDDQNIKAGESWEDQIRNALLESEVVISVFGGGRANPNVLFETGMAFAAGKPVLPVILDASNHPTFIPPLPERLEVVRSDTSVDATNRLVKVLAKHKVQRKG